jgi:hypothetical protein
MCRNVGDEALLELPKFPLLSSLILRSTTVTNDGLKPLGSMACLEQLDLGSKWEINDAGRSHCGSVLTRAASLA